MFRLARKFLKPEGGIAAIELALVTPIFLMLFLSMIELGHMIYYSVTVEKALRSAVTWVGRNEVLTADVIASTENIARTGQPTGGEYLVKGWADPIADVQVSSHQFIDGDIEETVYTVSVSVPYVPVVDMLVPALEYLMSTSFQEGKYMIVLTQEQALIGN